MNPLVLCGECYSLVPLVHQFKHRFFHQRTIQMGLLGRGHTPVGAEQAAERAAQLIQFEPFMPAGLEGMFR